MKDPKAIYYGKIELIPGIICDGYVLDDNTAVMSERGTADLLGVDQKHLSNVRTNWPPKILKPFIDKASSVRTNSVKVIAENSPHKGRKISTYNTAMIENLIRSYLLAFASKKLRRNQQHIGERCAVLSASLMKTALDTAIKQACGLSPNIQQIAQQNYVELVKQFGFTCSFDNEIATKKDITNFLDIPISTLNSFLKKRQDDTQPIKLDHKTIKANGGKANRMNGYSLEDVSKIALGMDSVIGIELKKQAFGHIGTIAKPDTKGEIEWQQILAQVFEGFGFHHNYTIGSYRADFFVKDLRIILECNGYDNHRNYNQQQEAQREQLLKQNYSILRFHHKITPEKLFNGILQAKMGKVIKLYDIGNVYPKTLSI
ncbi:DUF559 domain-containing protein [Candidatus Halobeggiatoa sp. HSG11]|nr:DUF559 domain-containing protein [Candidatus Halobeggiatoa sp. HSG11]